MGIPRTSHGPLGTLGWEGQWDWGGLGETWESQGLPMVHLGLWDVLTGLRDCDGKLGHHSESRGLSHLKLASGELCIHVILQYPPK